MILLGRLEATEKVHGAVSLPRVIRLARRYKMSPVESEVLVYCLVCNVARHRRPSFRFDDGSGMGYLASDTLQVCRSCDIGIVELMDFLSMEREHMQHGLFPDIQASFTLHSSLTYEETVCKMLVGCSPKNSEFLRLEQTCLADVLAEEPGGEKYRNGAGMGGVTVPLDAPTNEESTEHKV